MESWYRLTAVKEDREVAMIDRRRREWSKDIHEAPMCVDHSVRIDYGSGGGGLGGVGKGRNGTTVIA